MAEEKSLADQLIDLLVYAPVGLALAAREQLPDLIERGRREIATQLNAAHLLTGRSTTDVAPERTPAAEAPPPGSPPATSPNGEVPAGDHLAVPGYDTLSASQVVQRLAGLTPDELEAVREYEAATRGRRTILAKIDQLQAGA